jgi:chromosome partitioning protein
MAIYLFGGEKGGVGKTTLATNMAAMRAASKRVVLLADLDTQNHASIWNEVRTEEGGSLRQPLTCVSLRGRGIAAELRKLSEHFQDIIVDAGGRDTIELRQAMLVADLMIVPVRPSQLDLQSLALVDRLIGEVKGFNAGTQAIVVMNAASTNAKNVDVEEARAIVLEMRHLAMAKSVLCDRVAFRRAYRDGLAVVEYQPADEKARLEARHLYSEIFYHQKALSVVQS